MTVPFYNYHGTNLIVLQPSDLSGPNWSTLKFGGGAASCTTTQGAGPAPDGTNNLNKITDNSVNGNHGVYLSGINPTANGVYTFECDLQEGSLRWAQLLISDRAFYTYAVVFDLLAGTAGTPHTLNSPLQTSATIAPVPGFPGLYNCKVSILFTGAGVAGNLYGLISASNSASPSYGPNGEVNYVGDGTGTIFMWNAQLYTGNFVGYDGSVTPWQQAGYNVNTFHCPSFSPANVDVGLTRAPGFQWYLTGSFNFADTPAASISFPGDGSIVLNGLLSPAPLKASIIYSIAAKGTPVTDWHGTAFGGGAYFEATLSFDPSVINNAGGANGFPAWWADPVEHGAQQSIFSDNWQGQADGYVHFVETDFFEYNVWTSKSRAFQYNGTVIDWSGVYVDGSGYPTLLQNGTNRAITLPVGVDFTQPHRYGFLWVPATTVKQGYFQWFFDGLPTSDRVYYSYYDPVSSPSPPATQNSPWLFGALDSQHPELILNSGGADSLRVYSVDVWQASAANNIVK